jgi:hypothetical protein
MTSRRTPIYGNQSFKYLTRNPQEAIGRNVCPGFSQRVGFSQTSEVNMCPFKILAIIRVSKMLNLLYEQA